MCKHIAAALYGIGARLDNKPEQLFVLRHVNHEDLISIAETAGTFSSAKTTRNKKILANDVLSSLFGIEIDEPSAIIKKAKKATPKIRKKPLSKAPKKGKSN